MAEAISNSGRAFNRAPVGVDRKAAKDAVTKLLAAWDTGDYVTAQAVVDDGRPQATVIDQN